VPQGGTASSDLGPSGGGGPLNPPPLPPVATSGRLPRRLAPLPSAAIRGRTGRGPDGGHAEGTGGGEGGRRAAADAVEGDGERGGGGGGGQREERCREGPRRLMGAGGGAELWNGSRLCALICKPVPSKEFMAHSG